MANLYVALLGMDANGFKIEIHDICFLAGESIESTLQTIKKLYTHCNNVHVDSYVKVTGLGGYKVNIVEQKPINCDQKLWLLNFGGTKPAKLVEYHKYLLVIARNEEEAKISGREVLGIPFDNIHLDDILDIENELKQIPGYENLYIDIKASELTTPVEPIVSYIRVSEKETK